MPRVQSCPNLVHRCDWPDWQSQIQVRTLCERSEHIGDETQATLKFPQPGASQGSHGHPDLCRRPCILFLHGKCQEVHRRAAMDIRTFVVGHASYFCMANVKREPTVVFAMLHIHGEWLPLTCINGKC
eukprot:g17547.t2